MGFDKSTLKEAEELEEIQKRAIQNAQVKNSVAQVRQELIRTLESQKVDEPQTLFDKILRKLGLQRIR